MSFNRLFIVASLLMASLAFAAPSAVKKAVKKIQAAAEPKIQFGVVYGDKITSFNVFEAKNGGKVVYQNNQGATEKTEVLSKADYDYLKQKVAGLKGPSNNREFCPRSYVVVKGEGVYLLGCLGAQNKLAKEILGVTNLLSLLF